MNEFDSLRGITRRALRIEYISPLVCMNEVIVSASGTSEVSTLDIIPTLRQPGPVSLTVSDLGGNLISIEWPAVDGAYAYIVYRADGVGNPFAVRVSGTLEFSFVDSVPGPGTYVYKVTAIEPNYGETFPSPESTITV